MRVYVKDNNVNQAFRKLKKKLHDEGIIKELQERKYYTKPSEVRRRKKIESARRQKKEQAKREAILFG